MDRINIKKVVDIVRGEVLAGENLEGCTISKVYAGDRISDLIVNASEETLIVTHINNISLLQLLDLFNVPAICLVSQGYPDDEVVDRAKIKGKIVFKSQYDMFETCGRIYQLLYEQVL